MLQGFFDVLNADGTLTALLPGGIYHTALEITREGTGAAFNAENELLNCLLIKRSGETPTGPYQTSSQQAVDLYFYQRSLLTITTIDQAKDRAYAILNTETQRLNGSPIWEVSHTGDVLDQHDAALNAKLHMCSYLVTYMRGAPD